MRCYAAARASSAGSSTLSAGNLHAIAARPLYLREVVIFNTTATETEVALRRITTAGTGGAAVDEHSEDSEITPVGVVTNTVSGGPTFAAGFVRMGMLAAAIGSGIYWTFGSTGLRIPAGTANGVGLTVPNGTGQVWDFEFVWDE